MYFKKVFKYNYIVSVIILTIIGLIIRYFNLEFQSLWLDEHYTINFSNKNNNINQIFNYLKSDGAHPSLYYLIIHFIFNLTDNSGYFLRLFSCIIGTLMIPLSFILGKNILDKKLGIILTFLITFNPYLIKYSQEGRMYILFCLFLLLTTIYFSKIYHEFNKKNLYIFTLFAILLINTHFYGYFMLFGFGIIILYNNYNKIKIKDYLIIGNVFIISNLPNLYILISSVKKEKFWIKKSSPDYLFQYFNEFNFNNDFITIISLFIIYFAYTNGKYLKLDKYIYQITIVIISTVLLPLIISYIKLPMLVERYYIGMYLLIIIILAIGFRLIKTEYIIISIFSYIFFSFFTFFYLNQYYGIKTKDDFDRVAEYISKNPKHIFISNRAWCFKYYFKENLVLEDSIGVNNLNIKIDSNVYYINRIGSSIKTKFSKNEIIDTIKFKNIEIYQLTEKTPSN